MIVQLLMDKIKYFCASINRNGWSTFLFSTAGTFIVILILLFAHHQDCQKLHETYLYFKIIHHLSEIQI